MSKFPSHVLEEQAIAAGATVRCMWQTRGPKDTGVAWLECLQIGPRGDVVIVETFHHGGWNAFSAPHSNSVDDTIRDVLERCGAKGPPNWRVMADGTQCGNYAGHTIDEAIDRAKRAGHVGRRWSAIQIGIGGANGPQA